MWTILIPAILVMIVFCLYIKHRRDSFRQFSDTVYDGFTKEDFEKMHNSDQAVELRRDL